MDTDIRHCLLEHTVNLKKQYNKNYNSVIHVTLKLYVFFMFVCFLNLICQIYNVFII